MLWNNIVTVLCHITLGRVNTSARCVPFPLFDCVIFSCLLYQISNHKKSCKNLYWNVITGVKMKMLIRPFIQNKPHNTKNLIGLSSWFVNIMGVDLETKVPVISLKALDMITSSYVYESSTDESPSRYWNSMYWLGFFCLFCSGL